jgi:hypothetical protein
MARLSQNAADHAATVMRVRQAIARYRRDLALLGGRLLPMSVNIDDLLFLEFISLTKNPKDVVNDRMIRIKTLEATLDLLTEEPSFVK